MLPSPRVLLFGGTSQGRHLSQTFTEENIGHFYSTKTETLHPDGQFCKCLFGGMDAGKIATFCTENNIDVIIDASHPFAEMLHEEICTASEWSETPVFRYEREQLDRIKHPLIHYAKSFDEAICLINASASNHILAATGVNTIAKLHTNLNHDKTVWYRILNKKESLEKAERQGVSVQQLLISDPKSSAAEELAVIRRLGIDCVISKESGITGGLQYKISACLAESIPIFIVAVPHLPDGYIIKNSIDGILDVVRRYCRL